MRLYMPTEVYFEEACVQKHKDLFSKCGSKVMIVTGAHSSGANGSLQDVKDALEQEGISYVIFDQVEENPSVETCVKGAVLACEFKADCFVGIGGGSPMDAAKSISLLCRNPKLIPEARTKLYDRADYEAYPVICVPTTCGTGSEVTGVSVLTRHDKRTKGSIPAKIFPRYALVDAKYLKTASTHVFRSTAVDALAHLMESYLNKGSNALNRVYAAEGLRVFGKVKERLYGQVEELTDAELQAFMHASVLGGMAIAQQGTALPHALSYILTYECGIPHGFACGMFLGKLAEEYPVKSDVEQVLTWLGFENTDALKHYLDQVVQTAEVPAEIWERDVEEIHANPGKMGSFPGTVTKEELLNWL